MDIDTTISSSRGTIKLQGRFDAAFRPEFSAAMRKVVGTALVKEIVVDFDGVGYIHSSACGMLLLLKEKAAEAGKTVSLSGVQGDVKTVFKILGFNSLFTII